MIEAEVASYWETCEVSTLWRECLEKLQGDFTPQQKQLCINTLQIQKQGNHLVLLTPNGFVFDWVMEHFIEPIKKHLYCLMGDDAPELFVEIGSKKTTYITPAEKIEQKIRCAVEQQALEKVEVIQYKNNLNPELNYDNFVKGNSNQLAVAASMQVGNEPGGSNNPLLIYGGVGLGKTHLMHAVGNYLAQKTPGIVIFYIHAERFVSEMVKAIQTNRMNEFKNKYREAGALLIDDIQFFAGKERSQEEFFHTFNELHERGRQIIMTCDCYPKEINGLEERLKSRFGWGLAVAVEPPELETRVAILMSKAEKIPVSLPYEAAFLIAKKIRSNVRELEGALKRVVAHANFTGQLISLELVKDALKDLLYLQDKLVTIDNIIKTTAEYYKIKEKEIRSTRRTRSVARPRQMAMALAKELTNHSLPEIGEAFGGRDHTTVLHACRKIKELRDQNNDIEEDYKNLMRILTT
jgi:chromosomal replication initiator protein